MKKNNPLAALADKNPEAVKTPNSIMEEMFPGFAGEFGEPFSYRIERRTRMVDGESAKVSVWVPKSLCDRYFGGVLVLDTTAPCVFDADEGTWLEYNPDKGYYVVVASERLVTRLQALLKTVADKCDGNLVDTESLRYGLQSVRSLTPAITAARGLTSVRSNFWRRPVGLLPLRNGVLNYVSGELLPHSPDRYFRGVMAVDYDPEATCPQYLALLHRCLSEEDVELVQRHHGMCLLGRNTSQSMLILQGLPRSGKGTDARILVGMLGRDNVGTLRTAHLEHRFEAARLRHKMLIYGGDVGADFLAVKEARQLKAILGGDPMSCEYKSSNAVEAAEPIDGCVLVTTNSRLLVRFEGDKEAWRRRLTVAEFNGEALTPEQVEDGLAERLLREEGSGILTWYLEGLRKVLAAKGQLLLSDTQRARVAALLDESEATHAFARECLTRCEGRPLMPHPAYTAFVAFCNSRGWAAVTPRRFETELKDAVRMLYGVTQSHDLGVNQSARGWRGVALANDDDPDNDLS